MTYASIAHEYLLAEAERDCSRLVQWWHLRGYVHVTATPHIIGSYSNGSAVVLGIRSNLKAGLPPGATPGEVAVLYRGREVPFK